MDSTRRVWLHHSGASATGGPEVAIQATSQMWSLVERRVHAVSRSAVACRLIHPQDADDLRQDLYVALHQRLGRAKSLESDTDALIALIIRRAVIDCHRFSRRRKRKPPTRLLSIHEIDVDCDLRRPPRWKEQDQCDFRLDLGTASLQLSNAQRDLLGEIVESSVQTLARRREMPPSTLRSQAIKLRAKVRRLLRAYGPPSINHSNSRGTCK